MTIFFVFFVPQAPLFSAGSMKNKKEVTSASSAPCGEMPNREVDFKAFYDHVKYREIVVACQIQREKSGRIAS